MKTKLIINEKGQLEEIPKSKYKGLKLASKYMLVDIKSPTLYFYQDEKQLKKIHDICDFIPCENNMRIYRDYFYNDFIFNTEIRKAHIFSLGYALFFKMFCNTLNRLKFVNCSLYLKNLEELHQ